MPLTRNTIVAFSLPASVSAQRKEPSPLSANVVTSTTLPPRPPEAYLPKPSAVGNANVCAHELTAKSQKPNVNNVFFMPFKKVAAPNGVATQL